MLKRALISVSNKQGLEDFARGLHELGIEIISTGGTAKFLQDTNISVTDVAEITGFPEIMDGRVKTLHPKIAGGILGKRDQHAKEAEQHNIPWIDLVVCNLYPFAETIAKPNVDLDTALESIDIGGPTMIRAAAKNFSWVGVIVNPNDYSVILAELQKSNDLDLLTRMKLAAKAFAHTAQYDALIAEYLTKTPFPEQLTLAFDKIMQLRYGENPHQQASLYEKLGQKSSLFTAQQHQGKQLSFNNIFDADSAIACLKEFSESACVVVKHANPCGVAEDNDINQAFDKAWHADSKSAFGSIVALNRICSKQIANFLSKVFIEIIIPLNTQKKH
jgi:phosphoribosylaminoimidazolecarboxamide formyltransferase/IMP cyclohydrolase